MNGNLKREKRDECGKAYLFCRLYKMVLRGNNYQKRKKEDG